MIEHKELGKIILSELEKMNGNDPNREHFEADALLCSLLLSHGYKDIVYEFNKLKKWYS